MAEDFKARLEQNGGACPACAECMMCPCGRFTGECKACECPCGYLVKKEGLA